LGSSRNEVISRTGNLQGERPIGREGARRLSGERVRGKLLFADKIILRKNKGREHLEKGLRTGRPFGSGRLGLHRGVNGGELMHRNKDHGCSETDSTEDHPIRKKKVT